MSGFIAKAPEQVLQVLKGARHRLNVGRPGTTHCRCNDSPRVKPPAPEASQWCFLCAVEAEQITLGLPGDTYGLALSEIAEDIAGRPFELAHWGDRDGVLFDALEDADLQATLAVFDETITRLEAEL